MLGLGTARISRSKLNQFLALSQADFMISGSNGKQGQPGEQRYLF